MHKSIPLTDVVSNPFRDMTVYPIERDKITKLIESMDRTGFWDNVVCRFNGKKYELGYGHHRIAAFREKYGDGCNITLIVKDLSDEDMLRMMADENMQEWESNALVQQETIRAVVRAYAEGKIELEQPKKDTNTKHIRYAPGFIRGSGLSPQPKPYTAKTIADFLGWKEDNGDPNQRIDVALSSLELIEQTALDLEDENAGKELAEVYAGKGPRVVQDINKAYKSLVKAHHAKGWGREPTKTVRRKALDDVKEIVNGDPKTLTDGKHKGSRRTIEQETERRLGELADKDSTLPTVEQFCRDLGRELCKLLSESDPRWKKVKQIIECRDDIDSQSKREITSSLEILSKRCEKLVKDINSPKLKIRKV